ncbi:MAG: hypothetical protein ABJA84_10135, partial [Polaromonas sp.]
ARALSAAFLPAAKGMTPVFWARQCSRAHAASAGGYEIDGNLLAWSDCGSGGMPRKKQLCKTPAWQRNFTLRSFFDSWIRRPDERWRLNYFKTRRHAVRVRPGLLPGSTATEA